MKKEKINYIDIKDEGYSDFAWSGWIDVTYRCDLSALYNRKRERFFVLCDRWAKFCSLIAGGAAFSTFLSTVEQKAMAGVIVSAVTLPSLLFNWTERARLHGELANKYLKLRADISRVGSRQFTQENINDWRAELYLIEQSEPSILSAVLAECNNHIASREHESENVISLSLRQKLFAHIFDTHIDWPHGKSPKDDL